MRSFFCFDGGDVFLTKNEGDEHEDDEGDEDCDHYEAVFVVFHLIFLQYYQI